MSKAIRVSIVDDEADLRENIAGYVDTAKGFKCVGVHSNAKEALANLPAEKPDVVLMDINLGGMSGIECVRLLKPMMPETQVVMLTVAFGGHGEDLQQRSPPGRAATSSRSGYPR